LTEILLIFQESINDVVTRPWQ